jgi:hypothetical protein
MPLEIVLMIISYFQSGFKELERPRSTGDDLENTLCWYSLPWRWTPMMTFDVTMQFKISILLYYDHLNSLAGVDLHLQI